MQNAIGKQAFHLDETHKIGKPFFAFRGDFKRYPSVFLRFVEAKSGDGPMGFLAAFNI